MLLNSGFPVYGNTNIPQYQTVDTLLEEASRQMAHMASSNLSRRSSRGSIGQRPGNSMAHSMRIVKPSSANSSPQRALASARRRSLMNDGLNYRRPALATQSNITNGDFQHNIRPSRPVSWHPSSQLASQAAAYGPIPSYLGAPVDTGCLSYSPIVYSGFNSPASSLSPGCPSYSNDFSQQYQPTDIPGFYQTSFENHTPAYMPTYACPPQYPQQEMYMSRDDTDSSMYSHFEWNTFSQHGFDAVTTPPTPEHFLPIQNHQPSLHIQDSTPYHPHQAVEDDGEELVALGLYDTPEKEPANLSNYPRALVSHLFDSGLRKPGPKGKGLKLEETWNPPASDDDDNEDEED